MPTTHASLSMSEARSVALNAQKVARKPAPAATTFEHMRTAAANLRIIQIDSVNVFARAHLMPFYSRLGAYDPADYARLTHYTGPTTPGYLNTMPLVESWAHEASYVAPETRNLLHFRMRDFRARLDQPGEPLRLHSDAAREILQLLTSVGPMTASQVRKTLRHDIPEKTEWGWNWSIAQRLLQHLFLCGDVVSIGRNPQFERIYDTTERAMGAVAHEPLERSAAVRKLMLTAAQAHGVGTLECFADYFRLSLSDAKPALEHLLAAGDLMPVSVQGWEKPTYLHRDAAPISNPNFHALLSPFDPVMWERTRVEKLFGMRYRIEIYVPAAKREFGYYVLPFLMDGALVARVDLKADRKGRDLVVAGLHLEPGAPSHTRDALHHQLELAAHWQGLNGVVYHVK